MPCVLQTCQPRCEGSGSQRAREQSPFVTFVLIRACDKGEEGREKERGVCLEPGIDACEENKILSLLLFSPLSAPCLPPPPPPALRTAGFRNGSLGSRPSAPFRSNVYQPTEMAVVLNGGTVSIPRGCLCRKAALALECMLCFRLSSPSWRPLATRTKTSCSPLSSLQTPCSLPFLLGVLWTLEFPSRRLHFQSCKVAFGQ